MMALLALLLAQPWNPNAGGAPARVIGVDGGAVPVYLINPAATDGGGVVVTNFPATQPVTLSGQPAVFVGFDAGLVTVANFPATQAISAVSLPTHAVTQSGTWTTQSEAHVALDGGFVSVMNFPATQAVTVPLNPVVNAYVAFDAGFVTVANFPASQAVTGPATDAQLRATPLPVSGTVAVSALGGSVAVTGTFWQATQPVSGTVAVSNFPASQAVTGSFFQATQPISAASLPAHQVTALGADGGTTLDVTGSVVYVIGSVVDTYTNPPLNPFLPRCNPVRRRGCQP